MIWKSNTIGKDFNLNWIESGIINDWERQGFKWIIGKPQKTHAYTVNQLSQMGMIGIYANF